MGQSSSRNESHSNSHAHAQSQDRPAYTYRSSWRSPVPYDPSDPNSPSTLTSTLSRTRRYSTNLVNTILQRSTASALTSDTHEASHSNLRRRSRFARAASALSFAPRSSTMDLSTSGTEVSPSLQNAEHGQNQDNASMDNDDLAAASPAAPQTETSQPNSGPSPLASHNPSRPQSASSNRRPANIRNNSSIADRISSLTPHRDFRNLTTSLRRRRSPAPNAELDTNAALSRLLSIAAAATAATLLGANSDAAMSDLRNAAGEVEGEDGSFSGFLQSLRNGRLTGFGQGDRNEEAPTTGTNAPPPSLEFFRMFRFGATQSNPRRQAGTTTSSTTQGDADQPGTTDDTQTQPEGQRMIPVLIVGIRALDGETDIPQETGDSVPSFLETLTGERQPPLQETETARRRQRHRTSMSGIGSATRDTLRRLRSSQNPRPRSFAAISETGLPMAEHSEPTVPQEAGGETVTSPLPSPRPRRSSFIRRMTETLLETPAEEDSIDPNPRPSRRRRMSDSDTPRYGLGSPRRNGVLVEPSDAPPTTDNTRSWIIYILGGSYPENHPILSTPSLFTDSPTYEDMLRLSSLLGPAKPPVANAEDVAAAGGVYKVKMLDGVIHAIGDDGVEPITIPGERCLVCLCDYEEAEEVRQLCKCSHVYHRECIDQWLTTGRNSCPLCRGQGVNEAKPVVPAATSEVLADAGTSTES